MEHRHVSQVCNRMHDVESLQPRCPVLALRALGELKGPLDLGQSPHLVADERLFNGSEILEGSKQEMGPLRPSNVLCETPKLVGESEEDLVLVVERLGQERDELVPRAVCAQGKGNG